MSDLWLLDVRYFRGLGRPPSVLLSLLRNEPSDPKMFIRDTNLFARQRSAAVHLSYVQLSHVHSHVLYANIPGGILIFFGVINNRDVDVESGTHRDLTHRRPLSGSSAPVYFAKRPSIYPDSLILVVQFQSLFIKHSRDCAYTRPLHISFLGTGLLFDRAIE